MPPRDAYMKRPHGVSLDRAQQNGWGPGWPNCQKSKIVELSAGGVKVSVRRELAELVGLLLTATVVLHRYRLKAHATGGYNCRSIRNKNTPSNHSWGLAVDLNWNDNPFQKPFKSDLPVEVIPLWWNCGFYWGGWYSTKPDPMHFEYVFTPADVPRHVRKAKELIMPFRDDGDARALIFRVEGLLAMRETIDNHVNNPHEPNKLTAVVNAIAMDAKGARASAGDAAAAARLAAESARAAQTAAEAAQAAVLDPAALEALLERVVRRVLAEPPPA
ncbi:M15 family metallopeptidase [Hamadaea sp. NPDC051192]|uniref:M15 family metallopeptidase n=1 Tax=Hamadaea sp. NPDC051192 TaxID=3154940 RepID=UPI00344132F1